MRSSFELRQSKFRCMHLCRISLDGHLPLMDWIFTNLTNSRKFAWDGESWELLFGSLVWLLWLRRNECIFEPEKVRWVPILSHEKQLQQECRAAVAVFRQLGVEPIFPWEQFAGRDRL
ncbi:hypothetical protein V6N12_050962 [Hibiscus sabdariffa]|uniref:Uncharacterized protein n=1 Tax=Hibiscus sabdariffa TaxID=183260 RepID=A0ABR2GE73_9ROSI